MTASLILPESTPGVWYIDLHGEDGSRGTARRVGDGHRRDGPPQRHARRADQRKHQASVSIIALQGSDFGSDTTVTLSNSGAQLAAYSVDVRNSTLLYASFQLDFIDAGVYDIVVTSHGQTTTLSNGVHGHEQIRLNQVTVTATGSALHPVRLGRCRLM